MVRCYKMHWCDSLIVINLFGNCSEISRKTYFRFILLQTGLEEMSSSGLHLIILLISFLIFFFSILISCQKLICQIIMTMPTCQFRNCLALRFWKLHICNMVDVRKAYSHFIFTWKKKILYFTIAQLNIIDNMKEIILDNFGLFLNISRLYQFNLWWTLLNKRI